MNVHVPPNSSYFEVEVDRPDGVKNVVGFARLENALGFICDLGKIASLNQLLPTPALRLNLFAMTPTGREQVGTETDWSPK